MGDAVEAQTRQNFSAEISSGDIDKLHKGLRETPYRANRALALLSKLMSLRETWNYRPSGSNPCRHIERFSEEPRTRFLSGEELKSLGSTLELMTTEKAISESAANAIKLLLLTGARLSEALTSRWSWVDYKQKIIALPDSKTGAKPIFLSKAALEVLKRQKAVAGESEYIFPGTEKDGRLINLRKPWVRVCSRAGLPGVRLHDLRHTAASVAVSQGASLPIVGRLLGHSPAQMTQRYAHIGADPAHLAANTVGNAMKEALRLGRKRTRPSKPDTIRAEVNEPKLL